MPLTSVTEKVMMEGSREPGKQTRKRLFQCFSDTEYEDQNTVIQSGLLPQIRDLHPGDSTLMLKNIEAKMDERHPKVWDVTGTYETIQPKEDETEPDPTQRRWKVEWDTVTREVPLVYDVVTGYLVTNSAGDTFDPPPLVDRGHLEVTLSKSFSSIPAWVLDYQDSVNDADFTLRGLSIGSGNARVTKLRISDEEVEVQEDGTEIHYYNLTINLVLLKDHEQRDPGATRQAGHKKRILDEGTHWMRKDIFGLPIDREVITLSGENCQKPVPLDGNGQVMAVAILGGTGVTDGPVSLWFDGYTPRDFSILNLPT